MCEVAIGFSCHAKPFFRLSVSRNLIVFDTVFGRYAYGTETSVPGQLKVHLGQAPVDGDYWVVGLGPATFGPDGAYEWAIVSGP